MPNDVDLIDVSDLLEYLELPESTATGAYERLITGASLAIEGFCGNALRTREFSEVYARPYGQRNLRLRHWPVVAQGDPPVVLITSITDPAGNVVDDTQYIVVSRDGVIRHAGAWPTALDLNGNIAEWTIVYTAGRFATLEDVTEDLKLACRLLVAYRSSSRSPGIASKTAGELSVTFRTPAAGGVSAAGMPDEVAGLLGPYVAHGV